jgi:hypothetical protein
VVLDGFNSEILSFPPLRFAVLYLAASNLSTLDTTVNCRSLDQTLQRSVYSPVTNILHQKRAEFYYGLTLQQCSLSEKNIVGQDAALMLATKVLLAYYHHASTDHFRFRVAVWDTVHFAQANRNTIMSSRHSQEIMQM